MAKNSFDEDSWVRQELGKITRENAAERYQAYHSDQKILGGSYYDVLLQGIRDKFPGEFSEPVA